MGRTKRLKKLWSQTWQRRLNWLRKHKKSWTIALCASALRWSPRANSKWPSTTLQWKLTAKKAQQVASGEVNRWCLFPVYTHPGLVEAKKKTKFTSTKMWWIYGSLKSTMHRQSPLLNATKVWINCWSTTSKTKQSKRTLITLTRKPCPTFTLRSSSGSKL